MRAVQCTGWDGVAGLRVDEVPVPPMQPGCVRIGIQYAGVAFANILMVEGKYQRRPELPFIPGTDVSGEIMEVAPDVEGFARGDSVCAFVDGGGWAEQLVHPVETVYPVGDGLPMDAASTLPSSYATALCSLTWRGGLSKGQTLLVLGAGGGVGLAAVDVASALGARVIAVASTPEKRDAALTLGADAAIEPADFRAQVRALTDGRGVDVVFDPIGGDVFHDALRCLDIGGRLLTIGYAAGDIRRSASSSVVENIASWDSAGAPIWAGVPITGENTLRRRFGRRSRDWCRCGGTARSRRAFMRNIRWDGLQTRRPK